MSFKYTFGLKFVDKVYLNSPNYEKLDFKGYEKPKKIQLILSIVLLLANI